MKGAIAGAVRAPLVLRAAIESKMLREEQREMVTYLPELLVLAVDVDPVLLHERQGVGSTLVGQEARDVGVIARRIAVLGEGAITAEH